jgi:Helix-turn-helix domain
VNAVMAPAATWKALGDISASLAIQSRKSGPRTTTDELRGVDAPSRQPTAKSVFDYGRHRWLCRVARDAELSGATLRTAILLWELLNSKYGYAWPSLTYIATELKMHKSTVIRSLHILRKRGWITIAHRGGRHRTNQYHIGFGRMEDDDARS